MSSNKSTRPILLLVAIWSYSYASAQSVGSVTTYGGNVGLSAISLAVGYTTADLAESLYIGPGSYQIDGIWQVYSKNIWISPDAIIYGQGQIRFFNPSVAGGIASPTFTDGNNTTSFINVNLQLNNASGKKLSQMMASSELTAAGWTDNTTSSTLNVGKDVDLAVDGANIILGTGTVGDLVFGNAATVSHYGINRMVVTNNDILSHVVKQNYTNAFTFPVGIAVGDYTPAQISNAVFTTVHVSVQDFAKSNSAEAFLRTKGMNRTWHVFADTGSISTITLQHNINTDNTGAGGYVPYNEDIARIVNDSSSVAWGHYFPFTYTNAIGNLQYSSANMPNTAKHYTSMLLPTNASLTSSYFTKDGIDIDSDDDGITDLNESGGYDPFGDCDGDGIVNFKDQTPGCPTLTGNDPWGQPYQPLTWTDCNGDGINDFFDWDRDGIINALDLDSDNDGILDVQEARPGGVAVTATLNGMITGTDTDGNGLLSSYENGNPNPVWNGISAQDLDRDGHPNFLDLDSDGDGLSDMTEALGIFSSTGQTTGADTDGDGVRSENFGSSAAATADNINGFGAKGLTLLDSDGDGKPDAYDIDSDNDGIPDNIEAQSTCGYKLPTGSDCNGNGIDDAYDITSCSNCSRASAGLTPYDKDGDGTPDYLDLDSDNDGAPDINEGSGMSGNSFYGSANADTDGDGLMDYFDGFNILTATSNFWINVTDHNMSANGGWDGPANPTGSIADLPESDGKSCTTNGDRDWRSVVILPVTLVQFKGNLFNAISTISWTVTNETDIERYELERGIDGLQYITIQNVAAKGLQVIQVYSANDNITNLGANTIYYRLKVFDKNGKYSYSNILVFKIDNVKTGMSVSPNPAKSSFTVKINVNTVANAMLSLSDMMGKTLQTKNISLSRGVNAISFYNLDIYAAGTYILKLQINDSIFFLQKIIIQR